MTTDDRTNGALLRRVQALDQQMDALRELAAAVPAQLAQWQDAIRAREIDKAMFLHQREDLLLKERKFELDIAEKQELRGKFNKQLILIKTNREYRALLEELEEVNNSIRNIEEIVLNAMTAVEAVDEELAKQDEAIATAEAHIQENKPRLDRELADLQSQIGGLQSERDELAGQVDPRLLTRYDRVRQRRGGSALAPVDVDHGVCGGCHMSLTPQMINEIIGGTLVQCSMCGRLLYYDEQAAESATA